MKLFWRISMSLMIPESSPFTSTFATTSNGADNSSADADVEAELPMLFTVGVVLVELPLPDGITAVVVGTAAAPK